jgi:hypothetical protein
MLELIGGIVSSLGSAISGGFTWSMTKLGLNNRAAMKDNAIAARDEGTKQQVEKDFRAPDPTKLEGDLDP